MRSKLRLTKDDVISITLLKERLDVLKGSVAISVLSDDHGGHRREISSSVHPPPITNFAQNLAVSPEG